MFWKTVLKGLLPTMTLILLLSCTPASGSPIVVNCSQPDQLSLLKELTPLFNLSAIRPVNDMRTCTDVTYLITLYGILGVNEKEQLLITYIWTEAWWHNEFVSWDPEQCGSDKISLPRNKFWVPDIVINEFMDINTAPKVPYVYLYSNGTVHDAQPIKVISSCNLDIYTFPFDLQDCHLTFNSFIHRSKDIKVFSRKSAEDIMQYSKQVMTTMGEWKLELMEVTKETWTNLEAATSIDQLVFHIEIRRRATMYVINLLIPSCFLITIDLFSFLLPPQNVDRSSFKMTLILGYTVFLLIMNDLLPVAGNTIPLINVFFSLCLALMVSSLLETVFITNLLLNSENFAPVPHWVRVLVLQILGCLVCMPMKKRTQQHSVAASSSVQTPAPKSQEEKGPMVEDKALEQLKNLSKDLQALRLQVEKQQQGNQSSEEWVQMVHLICKQHAMYICISTADVSLTGVARLLIMMFRIIVLKMEWLLPSTILIMPLLYIPASGSPIVVNCSEATQPSLLKELTPLFNLSAIRPVNDMRTCTNVTLLITIYGILGVNEKEQLLILYLWTETWWHNEFVSWDPEQCGTHKISLPRNRFWVPDIVINEFMDENTAPEVPYVYLYSNGTVHDSKPMKVISSCNLDIYTFPFDLQDCHLTFNSYIHLSRDIQVFSRRSAELIMSNSKRVMTTVGEWELIHLEFAKETFENGQNSGVIDELVFHIKLKRRATMYVVNLLIPSCFLITIDLFSFLLPPQNVDRSSFKMTLILGYTVFLLIMNDLLPITGNTIPLINVFFSLCLALMVASLLETVFITNLLINSDTFAPVPHWVRVLVLQILGCLVCLPMKKKTTLYSAPSSIEAPLPKSIDEPQEEKGAMVENKALEQLKSLSKDLRAVRLQVEKWLRGNQSSEEWVQVGFIIDRLLFGLYLLFISVSFLTIVVIWMNSNLTEES